MSRTNRFLGGASLGLLQQILVLVVGLWLTPFFLNRLGPFDYGIWLIITQISLYLGLLDLGVVGLLPRETARVSGRGGVSSPELPRLVAQTVRVLMWQWPIVAICAAAVWLLGHITWEHAGIPLAIILSNFVLMFPSRLLPALLQGLQDLAYLAKVQIIGWAAGTVVAIWLVFKGWGLLALALSWVVTQLVSTAFCLCRILRRFPAVVPTKLDPLDKGSLREFLKKGAWISTSQIAQILTTGTDVLLIGRSLGPTATVPYSCTGKLAGVLANKPQMIMQAAFPALSELRTAGSREQVRQASMALAQAMLAVSGAVACVVLAVNRGFVHWWTGPSQYGGGLLTLLIVVAMLVRHWNLTLTYSLFCFGYERRLALTGIADGAVSIIMSIILIPQIGSLGAPLGALAGTCMINAPANLIALGREMHISPTKLLSSSASWLYRCSLAALMGVLISVIWNPSGFIQLSAATVTVLAVYLSLVGPVLLREPLGAYLRPKLQFVSLQLRRLLPVVAD